MTEDTRPLMVTIQCLTYNHEPYIRQCLEGFVMQKTNFRFEAIVHDDASTDGTAAIVREYAEKYPEIIKPIFETENQYSIAGFSAVHAIIDKHTHGKYIALCEGDDYWIDPLKLQKQVDFLEDNPNYSACLTKFISYIEKSKQVYALLGEQYSSLKDMLLRDLQFGTATLVMRNELYLKYNVEISPHTKNWLMGDKPLVLFMGTQGTVKTLSDCTTVYRILEHSVSRPQDINLQLKKARNTIDIYQYFIDKYLLGDNKLKLNIEGGYLYRAYLIYKKSKKTIPGKLVQEILNYKGSYRKIYIVKVLLYLPYIGDLVYYLANIKNRVLYHIRCKTN